ncbi:hypothetical protein LCGC14_2432950, partial [marine sediment metagenome]
MSEIILHAIIQIYKEPRELPILTRSNKLIKGLLRLDLSQGPL